MDDFIKLLDLHLGSREDFGNASMLVPRALTAARPIPERSMNRQMQRAGAISRRSRVMASNGKQHRQDAARVRCARWCWPEGWPPYMESVWEHW